jgi:hypothetical protein
VPKTLITRRAEKLVSRVVLPEAIIGRNVCALKSSPGSYQVDACFIEVVAQGRLPSASEYRWK